MVQTDREWLHRVGFRSFPDARAIGRVAPFPAIPRGSQMMKIQPEPSRAQKNA